MTSIEYEKKFYNKFIVYFIINSTNHKLYVGKTKDIKDRWSCHRSTKKDNIYPIHKAIKKYGLDKFIFLVMEDFPTEIDMTVAEIWWIAKLKEYGCTLYNATDGGDGISGYKHTNETKNKISEKRKTLIDSGWEPTKHTEEWKQSLSKEMKGHTRSFGKKHPPDCSHCILLKERNKNNKGGSKKLNKEKVLELRKLAAKGVSEEELSNKFGIHPFSVNKIIRRLIWKNI